MKIALDEIPASGITVRLDATDPLAVTCVTPALNQAPEDVGVEIEVHDFHGGARITGRAWARVITRCDRCQAEVRVRLEGEVDLTYLPVTSYDSDGPEELSDEDMDLGWVDEGRLDLEAVLTEHFALLAPDRTRCDDSHVEQVGDSRPCELAGQPEMPDVSTSPFAQMLKNR